MAVPATVLHERTTDLLVVDDGGHHPDFSGHLSTPPVRTAVHALAG